MGRLARSRERIRSVSFGRSGLDCDLRLDLVRHDLGSGSYLPKTAVREVGAQLQVDSMVWFEQREGRWIPWSIELNHTRHTGMTVIDADGDGSLDIVGAVNLTWDQKRPKRSPALEVRFNRGPR